MTITQEIWGKGPDGKEIIRYTLKNDKGAYVQLSSVGAGITAIAVPDRNGKLTDVVLGYPEAASYFGDGPCAGKIPGRCANRIGNAEFDLDGKHYTLPANAGCNHLHGGPEGFQNQVWDSRIEDNAVVFTYISKDGEMGYPGELKATARYEWSEDDKLTLIIGADTDAPTVLNLTNHAYFNLNGEGNGDILAHSLKLHASNYLPTGDQLVPFGNLEPVKGTPMDFTSAKLIGRDMNEDFPALKFGKGYDNCWVIDDADCKTVKLAAELSSEQSGISLRVCTNQPSVQIYGGNWLSGCPEGKNGHIYQDYDGVAIECQNFPDAVHHPNFPTGILRPGEHFERIIRFEFNS